MLVNWRFILLFIFSYFSFIEAAKQKEKVKGLRVSKFGNGKSSLSIYVGIGYNDFKNERAYDRYRINKRIQVNDTELVQLLDFKKKNKQRITYDDLRYTILNETKISDLLETFFEETVEVPMASEPSFRKLGRTIAMKDDELSSANKTVMYKPTRHHWKSKSTLASAVLPTYIIIGIFTLIAYIGRARFFSSKQRLFKFSNVSRLICKFVFLRLGYDIIYLTYLVLFTNFQFFSTNGFLYFCFLVADEFINLIAFYFVIAMFVTGYMTLNQDRKSLYHPITIIMTLLYFFSTTAVEIVYKTKYQANLIDIFGVKDSSPISVDPTSFIAPLLVLSKIAIFAGACYFAYTGYRTSGKSDSRYFNSILVIGISYYCSSLISIPVFTSSLEFMEYFRSKFLSVTPNLFLHRVEAPQIIQIVVSCWLVYYWRDLAYDKVSSTDDSENSYELQ